MLALASWLASLLNLEDGVALTIISAYRVRQASAVRPNYPRDVVAHFLYNRPREAILQTARGLNSLQYKGTKVMVFWIHPRYSFKT